MYYFLEPSSLSVFLSYPLSCFLGDDVLEFRFEHCLELAAMVYADVLDSFDPE